MRHFLHKGSLIFLFFILLLSACINSETPIKEVDLPSDNKWISPQGESFKVDKDWWTQFGDPGLNTLVDKAVSQNLNLQIMMERVRLAEKAIGEAKLQGIPKVSADFGGKISDGDNAPTQENFTAAAAASWELDVWGKFSRMSAANLAEYKASEADWRASYLKLIKDLTVNYIFLRQYDEQRLLLEESLGYSEQLVNIYLQRFNNGIEDKTNLSLQKAESLRIKGELVEIDRARSIMENQIAILLGEASGETKIPRDKLTTSLKALVFPEDISANLLERRPDVIAAELRVQKDYQLSESTRAARLPSVSLGLSMNLENDAISLLTQGWAATILPKISFPALDPQTKINVEKQDINLEITKKQYKEIVIKAIGEVEDALINRQARLRRMNLEKRRFKELSATDIKNALNLEAGVISTLQRIEFQQQLISSRQQILDLYSQELQDTVAIFTALGGGW